MRKNARLLAASIAALSLFAAACGGDDKGTSTVAPEGSEAPAGSDAPATVIIAGVAFDTGGRGDGTFNDSAATGGERAASELGVEIKELEASSGEDRKNNLELLAGDGAQVIVGVGFMFTEPMTEVAAAYPDISFGIVDGFIKSACGPEVTLKNVSCLGFAEQEGSFLVGAAAALKSTTDQIGFIGGQESALIKRFEAGYTAGAKYINPDIVVNVKYLGPEGDDTAWGNVAGAKEIAAGWYAAGADIIYTAAGGSGAGTIEAAIEAGKWAIGVDSDQYLTSGDEAAQAVILTSMIKRVDVAVFETIKALVDGNKIGGSKTFNLANDGVGYSTSGGYLDDVVDQLEEIKAKIVAGEIEVPLMP
jgi:basic membrane protein A